MMEGPKLSNFKIEGPILQKIGGPKLQLSLLNFMGFFKIKITLF